jgi:hypothetical protein
MMNPLLSRTIESSSHAVLELAPVIMKIRRIGRVSASIAPPYALALNVTFQSSDLRLIVDRNLGMGFDPE